MQCKKIISSPHKMSCKAMNTSSSSSSKCKKECSSSSSSSCCPPGPCCPIRCEDGLSAYETICKKRAAVVSIVSQFDVTAQGFSGVPTGATGVTGGLRTFSMKGNGTLVEICK